MKVPLVDLAGQYKNIKSDIDHAIEQVLSNSRFVGQQYVSDFEQNFAKLYGVRHCIGVASGTDALYISLKVLRIGYGDEVITTANSWISTADVILRAGATPVFVDIEAEHYNIDSSKIEEKISLKTKAIIPVHLHGHPADMDQISFLCKKYNLYMVEDCAQAHLAEYKGKYVGLFGDTGAFSFYPTKNLGAYGDAGAIITNNDDLAQNCRKYANQGALDIRAGRAAGINSRLDGIQAAVLNVKLPYITEWTTKRNQVAQRYIKQLKNFEDITLPKTASHVRHVYHHFVIRLRKRDQLKKILEKSGIKSGIHYALPLPFQEHFLALDKTKNTGIPIAELCAAEVLSIPMFPELYDDGAIIDYICDTLRQGLEYING